jgi:hypothetical protein
MLDLATEGEDDDDDDSGNAMCALTHPSPPPSASFRSQPCLQQLLLRLQRHRCPRPQNASARHVAAG